MKSKVLLVKEDGRYFVDRIVSSEPLDLWLEIRIEIGDRRKLQAFSVAIDRALGKEKKGGKQ